MTVTEVQPHSHTTVQCTFYVENLQGDVIRIIDLAGTEVASYVYDAWGNIKDTKGDPTVRELNPIRYRGYVYDTETDLYY